jgi:hypothetical protein
VTVMMMKGDRVYSLSTTKTCGGAVFVGMTVKDRSESAVATTIIGNPTSIWAVVRGDLHALSEGEDNKPDYRQTANDRNERLDHCASRQLASASNESCRGWGSASLWSVRWVG